MGQVFIIVPKPEISSYDADNGNRDIATDDAAACGREFLLEKTKQGIQVG